MTTTFDNSILRMQSSASAVLDAQPALREEIGMLFQTVRVDRTMALGRARRLLEVMVVDHYIRWKPVTPPYRSKIKPLYNVIEELGEGAGLSQSVVALCHAVRLEGNRVLHYAPEHPDEPKWAAVSDERLTSTLRKLLEIAETLGDGGYTVYVGSLPQPFAEMFERLRRDWKPKLANQSEGPFPLAEAIELLFRSVVTSMKPEWLALLEKYADDPTLAERLTNEEEESLRHLRNLGLIQHDGKWLFTPTRSRKIWPTHTGNLFLALSGRSVAVNCETLAREVVQRLQVVTSDAEAVQVLDQVRRGDIPKGPAQATARRLRNLFLIAHESEFLVSADRLTLTDLGYYVLGKHASE